MSIMTVDGYHARIEYDEELDSPGALISMARIPESCAPNSRSH